MNDIEWNLIRKATYWILLDLDGQISLPPPLPLTDPTPRTIRELSLFVLGLDFSFQLDQTFKATSEALEEIADDFVEIHNIAASIVVNAPSKNRILNLRRDLNAIHRQLQGNQNFKAAVTLTSGVANVIGEVIAA